MSFKTSPAEPAEPHRPEPRRAEASAVALVDCDNFYCSCERVFDPKLRRRPLVVLSNNDGCVISRSAEAKALDIPMGAPFFKIRRDLEKNGVAIRSSNYALYGDMSRRVQETLATFTPDLEAYSIDECFIGLTASAVESIDELGERIRQRVGQWTGIPVSVGLAPTKSLAKIATHQAKRSGSGVARLFVEDTDYEAVLRDTPIRKVWGVGHRLAPKFESVGIPTAWHLRGADEAWVQKQWGVTLARLVRELRGVPSFAIETNPPPKKAVAFTRSFGVPPESLEEMSEAVSAYVSKALRKLRKQRRKAGVLSLYLRTFDKERTAHSFASRTIELPVATDWTHEIARHALAALEEIYRPGVRYKKAGVILHDLRPTTGVQQSIFDDEAPARRLKGERLMQAVDIINQRHGAEIIQTASEGLEQRWQLRCAHRSPKYTSRWTDVLVVRC
ncbi:MAG: Y-family DNA polymerase [Deltaproteobacteria bacterium]|nr:Y-family DNA polymerase [Deltaproteobacteria bacterium]